MNISIIANCQGESLAACVRAMTGDGVNVSCHMIHEITRDPAMLEHVLGSSNYVFAQSGLLPHLGSDHPGKIHLFPTIAFSAYHPDLTFVRGRRDGGPVETVSNPLSGYHSAIALFGFLAGISQADIVTFYHAGVYSRLGYFDRWETSRRELLDEGDSVGMPLNRLFERWSSGEAFMYSSNHPSLRVMEDLTRILLNRVGIPVTVNSVHEIIDDPLRAMPIWPKYPEIAERLDLEGSMTFRPHVPERALTLTELVASSYDIFAEYDRDSLEAVNASFPEMARRLGFAPGSEKPSGKRNPYAQLPKHQFWRDAVAGVPVDQLDPVVAPRFSISPTDKVATAGSCFAQHIARTLSASGFNYFVPEAAPESLTAEEAFKRNYGVFSARFGNIYTVRQLRQLIERAEGWFDPSIKTWEGRAEGKLVDPFRPQIEPDGFDSEEELLESSGRHLEAVRTMLRDMDVFVFTLGLTEGWRAKFDGAVYPLAPGVAGGRPDADEYEFVNFKIDDVRADLDVVIGYLRQLNADCRIILTVSPVPLIATYENRHALVSTTYSKSVLRAAADEMWRKYAHVDYFPSYEIITGSFNRGQYFAEDLREVKPEGVAHVMGRFMRHYTGEQDTGAPTAAPPREPVVRDKFFDIVCDEEMIANFAG